MLQEQLNSRHPALRFWDSFIFTGDLHLKSHCQICMHKRVARPEAGMVPWACQSHPSACCTPTEQHQAGPEWPGKAPWHIHHQLNPHGSPAHTELPCPAINDPLLRFPRRKPASSHWKELSLAAPIAERALTVNSHPAGRVCIADLGTAAMPAPPSLRALWNGHTSPWSGAALMPGSAPLSFDSELFPRVATRPQPSHPAHAAAVPTRL